LETAKELHQTLPEGAVPNQLQRKECSYNHYFGLKKQNKTKQVREMSTGGEANLILLWNTVVEIYIFFFSNNYFLFQFCTEGFPK